MAPTDAERERLAEELGRHYVAGHLEADEIYDVVKSLE